MVYEYKSDISSLIIDNPSDIDGYAHNEIQEIYKKAEAFDEVKNFITERLKEQKLTDEYDFGERFICEEIEDIIGGKLNG